MVMMFVRPFQAELTSTIGPGSRKRRMFETGKSFFLKTFTARTFPEVVNSANVAASSAH
jgi:hypothetical protein